MGKGNGSGTWMPKKLIEKLYDGHSLDIVDFNKDGHLDIFIVEMKLNSQNPGFIRILSGDGKGNFVTMLVAEDIGCHEGKMPILTSSQNHITGMRQGWVSLLIRVKSEQTTTV